jgi:hypothetical protein
MSNTKIQTILVSRGASAGLINVTDDMTMFLLGLIRQYAPGLSNFYKGLRPISAESISIPCAMVQPMSIAPMMNTTAKFHKKRPFDIWFVVGGTSIEECVENCTSVAEIFTKLFSNNAKNDLGSASESNNYKKYSAGGPSDLNWLDSEMTTVEWSPAFLSGRPGGPKYIAVGSFLLTLETQSLV